MQIQGMVPGKGQLYTSFPQAVAKIYREEGLAILLGRGLGAAMAREMSYSGVRMGLYDPVKEWITRGKQAHEIGFLEKFVSGGVAGGVGSFIASPFDLIKIRMQGVLPGQEKPYRNFVHGFTSIYTGDGISGLYKGASATVVRAMVLTASQLSSYDHTKHVLIRDYDWKDSTPTHIVSSVVAGLVTTIASSPVDVVKSRFMNDQGSYKGVLDCFVKTIKNDGVLTLWKGFTPNYIRIGTHCLITLPLVETVRKLLGLTTI